MSLLNEMLHDLAKQKQAKQAAPLFIPVLPKNRKKNSIYILLLSLIVFIFIFYFFLSHHYADKKNMKKSQIPYPIKQNEFKKERKLISSAPSVPKVTSTESIILTSYIEPLISPISQRVIIQLPQSPSEPLSSWVDHQGEPSSVSVNKIYSPQTLEEWHDAQLNKALQAIDKGFDDQAITLLEEILIKIPNASDARENLALLYLAYKDYSHADEILNEGLKYTPAGAALITIKARLLLDQGKAAAAIRLLSQHRPSMTSYPDFYATLAAALQSEGRILESGSIYQSLIQIDPNDGRYWLGFAIALENKNKINQAINAYNRASQNPESDPNVRDYAEKRLKILQG